jgi:hypothetical protein
VPSWESYIALVETNMSEHARLKVLSAVVEMNMVSSAIAEMTASRCPTSRVYLWANWPHDSTGVVVPSRSK